MCFSKLENTNWRISKIKNIKLAQQFKIVSSKRVLFLNDNFNFKREYPSHSFLSIQHIYWTTPHATFQRPGSLPSGVSIILNFFLRATKTHIPHFTRRFRSLLFEHRHLRLTLLLPTPLCKRLEGKVGTSPNYW